MSDYIFWGFACLTILAVCYIFGLFEGRRSLLAMRLARLRSQAGLGDANNSFLRDYHAGLSSQNFDITINIDDGDTRPGLDSDEVRGIMEEHDVSFDKARLIRQQRLMKHNDIDPATGMPMDPKAVTFGR
ncbi:hypothetical protein GGI25_004260 [Coemansia spiralis]|uniref:Uncharacterized protein n=2 Tax=Coemansia TaxID=4863 RepID=A0A9W8KX88_9FUNG|nr:hypothetical protein BX070DRAFT_225037 [Coemansia spiralis]KAJ1990497.1 hypothetical protein EDC05_004038 [Coemansia umbellata]KAJ2620803.1 hypothetical protein GGI26_004699 [Coemansia sp. RSA 1358]KAJ2674609.1 hypothetical protein GGI25_004260 [Coemansia spiralis]